MSAGRRVLIHEDDLGMCHGANAAFSELSANGLLDGGSIMVPCPWFPEVAEMAAADSTLDVGVHLTLNAEKEHYRWRPITRPSAAAGLVDENGFMWRTVAGLRAHCAPAAAEAEMRAQIDLALEFGIDVTHLDAHMFAALAPEYCDAYLRIGVDYALPVMLTELFDGKPMPRHLDGVDEEAYHATVARAQATGFTVFDRLIETDWHRTGSARQACEAMFADAGPGLTYMALHPNAPGEVAFIEPKTAHIRIGEYETFHDSGFQQWLAGQGLDRVTWREMRQSLRSRRA